MGAFLQKVLLSSFMLLGFFVTGDLFPRGNAESTPCIRTDNNKVQELLDGSRWGKCPTLVNLLTSPSAADCNECICEDDTQCDLGYRCCYNGCVRTCVQVDDPAPVIDWLEEPLLEPPIGADSDHMMNNPVEMCSTSNTEDLDDQLKCPTGFVCLIQDDGDEANQIPNRGVCVQE